MAPNSSLGFARRLDESRTEEPPPDSPDTMECDDGHKCENGSICVEVPGDEGTYLCDCEMSPVDQALGGLRCEHEATVYCNLQGDISKKGSFCTNGGECTFLNQNADDETHVECNCPDNYEGDHCEFVLGTKPDNWQETKESISNAQRAGDPAQSTSSSSLGSGAVAGIVLVVLLAALVVAVIVRRAAVRRRNAKEPVTFGMSENDTGATASVPADGDVLDKGEGDGKAGGII